MVTNKWYALIITAVERNVNLIYRQMTTRLNAQTIGILSEVGSEFNDSVFRANQGGCDWYLRSLRKPDCPRGLSPDLIIDTTCKSNE